MAMSGLNLGPHTNIHASAFVFSRYGVLVRGPSGAGKSLLVQAAIERAKMLGHFAGWIADDRLNAFKVGRALVVEPAPTLAGRAELRFFGIMQHDYMAAARVDLVVDIVAADRLERMPENEAHTQIAGVDVPIIAVPKADREHALMLIFQYFFDIDTKLASKRLRLPF